MLANKILIITAPSGAGKTSITKYLLEKFPALSFSTSATTRNKRHNEIDGKDYHFISEQEFENKISNNEFIEWEMVYEGKYYGTLKTDINNLWIENKIPILDIDVKGAIHVQQQFRTQVCSIFIMPPSILTLKERLIERGTETPKTLEDRINKAAYEISFKEKFDYIVINDNLSKAKVEAEDIVRNFLKD